MKGVLKYNSDFGRRRTTLFERAQQFVDSEVLKFCDVRAPFKEGVLRKSGILMTIIGSGLVMYRTPYARRLYYNPQYKFRGAPMRGGLFFERGKAVEKQRIMRGAGAIAGGGR